MELLAGKSLTLRGVFYEYLPWTPKLLNPLLSDEDFSELDLRKITVFFTWLKLKQVPTTGFWCVKNSKITQVFSNNYQNPVC